MYIWNTCMYIYILYIDVRIKYIQYLIPHYCLSLNSCLTSSPKKASDFFAATKKSTLNEQIQWTRRFMFPVLLKRISRGGCYSLNIEGVATSQGGISQVVFYFHFCLSDHFECRIQLGLGPPLPLKISFWSNDDFGSNGGQRFNWHFCTCAHKLLMKIIAKWRWLQFWHSTRRGCFFYHPQLPMVR